MISDTTTIPHQSFSLYRYETKKIYATDEIYFFLTGQRSYDLRKILYELINSKFHSPLLLLKHFKVLVSNVH